MVIDDYIPLARKVANWYYTTNPNKMDDILCQAYLGLCVAWQHRYRAVSPDKLEGYIVTTIKRHISDYLVEDHTVRIPRHEYKKRYLDENGFIPTVTGGESLETEAVAHCNDVPLQATELKCCVVTDEMDERILEQLLLDRGVREIGAILGVSHNAVHLRVLKMREKAAYYKECKHNANQV